MCHMHLWDTVHRYRLSRTGEGTAEPAISKENLEQAFLAMMES
jgi:hypothetical protein